MLSVSLSLYDSSILQHFASYKASEQRCERTSEQRSEWPSTLRVDFIVILPTVGQLDGLILLPLSIWSVGRSLMGFRIIKVEILLSAFLQE